MLQKNTYSPNINTGSGRHEKKWNTLSRQVFSAQSLQINLIFQYRGNQFIGSIHT